MPRRITISAIPAHVSAFASVIFAFVFMSAAVTEIPEKERQANHSNKARFDDSVLGDGAVLLAALAFDHLGA